MPADDRHPDAFCDRLEAVRLLIRIGDRGQEQRVEHRLRETHAGRGLLHGEEPHVERRRCGDEHGSLGEAREPRQHVADDGLACQQVQA